MNTFRIFLFTLLFGSVGMYAQSYSNSNRHLQNYAQPKKPTSEEIEKNQNENVDKYMAKLNAALNLDELQAIAIRNEVLSNVKSIDIVMKKEDSQESKGNEIKALLEKTDVIVTSYLSKEQKEKYLLFKANLKNKKGGAKDKKGKKEDQPTEE